MTKKKKEPVVAKTWRLFHGTSEIVAKAACVKGLSPYQVDIMENGSPRNFCAATFHGVCLTTMYPGLSSFNTATYKERWGIIEIDPAHLHPEAFMPYEGYILEKAKGNIVSEDDKLKKLENIRQSLQSHGKKWRESLDNYGVCVYIAAIPVQAITKVTIYDPQSNWTMTKAASSLTLGSRFHASNKKRQEMVTRWLTGGHVSAEEWVGPSFSKMVHAEKDKISQILQNKYGLDVFYSSPQNGKKSAWW